MTDLKKCTLCELEKPTSEFFRKKDAFLSRCKICCVDLRRKKYMIEKIDKKYSHPWRVYR